jgi:hypothetical protein
MTLDRLDQTPAEQTPRYTRRENVPPDYDQKRARREWSQKWGIKIGAHHPCFTRQLQRKRCPGSGCCYWTGDNGRPHALDHIYAITRQRDHTRGVLTMSYGLTDDAALEPASWCQKRTCHYTVLGDGWHYPGTIAIVIFPTAAP